MDEIEKKPRILPARQAAALIDGLTVYRLRQLCTSGELKHHMFGNRLMVSEDDLLQYFSNK